MHMTFTMLGNWVGSLYLKIPQDAKQLAETAKTENPPWFHIPQEDLPKYRAFTRFFYFVVFFVLWQDFCQSKISNFNSVFILH